MPLPRLRLATLLVSSVVVLLACGDGDPEVVDRGADGATDPSIEDGSRMRTGRVTGALPVGAWAPATAVS